MSNQAIIDELKAGNVQAVIQALEAGEARYWADMEKIERGYGSPFTAAELEPGADDCPW